MLKKKIKKFGNNNAYMIFVGAIILALVLIITNWFVMGAIDRDATAYLEEASIVDNSTKDPDLEGDFWYELGYSIRIWFNDNVATSPVFEILTLNIYILNCLGFVGDIIKLTIGSLIIIGIVDIIWIG